MREDPAKTSKGTEKPGSRYCDNKLCDLISTLGNR